MSPGLPVVSGADAVRALQCGGFDVVSQRGSHVKLHNDNGRAVIVPLHRELAPGTLRSILRQSGPSARQFVDLLRLRRLRPRCPDSCERSGSTAVPGHAAGRSST